MSLQINSPTAVAIDVELAQAGPGTASARGLPNAADLLEAQQGNAIAFARLVRAHQAHVFSVALRLTGNREDAEELAQDAFVRLHSALAQLSSPAHALHWLLRTITHRCIDRLRSRGRMPRLVQIDADNEPAASDAAADPLWARRLRSLLLQLPPVPRTVVTLRFQMDLELAEIAAVLDIPVNTVKSHLRRSLEWLRAQQAGDGHGN
jgi:RNA polymerase sigma-70 factor, ECF subfamily